MPLANVTTTPSGILLSGDVVFDNVVALENAGKQAIQTNPTEIFTLDLAQLGYSNSLVLTLILAWMRFAKNIGKEMHIINTPQRLAALAHLSELEFLFE
jgi:phospholipid transport system transporter-binding protein